ncbi:saccharopine dehydrogenase family protein [Thermomonospora umbrina]|uniref:Saccharopine dehydrogenase-like NADP-dependent oxidoreductase n=1 Tax=Thermomonospora umbrina TaxID=111806 RepID=A0A3D9SVD5_9ACTN|nr:saccharopine dehydrogenase NADP-binding domain-containing protein [Thermomonospora umbrina]REE96965.1 saccharopine dehydrogenase-like NADP-dependent oxidoreductase [Thermomonospora umbrina]
MRVVMLGGAGGMGREACRLAAAFPEIDSIVIADTAADAAAGLAAELGPRAERVAVDITDRRALERVLTPADIVVNTVGPYFRFGPPVLRAAIDAGCHYLDICDDPEPTLRMLESDALARAAGVTAVIGLGASPGIVNLLALLAAAELDEVRSLTTGWNLEAGTPDPPPAAGVSAAIVHGVEQITGTIPVLRAGRLTYERPLRRVMIDYPGAGVRPAWTFGHPEAVTLDRAFPGLRDSVNVTFARRSTMAAVKLLGRAVDRRLLGTERAARIVQAAERRLPTPPVDDLVHPGELPPLFAHAVGIRNGRTATVGATLTALPGTSMAAVTATPLAIGLRLLAAGRVSAPGVHPPETVIDPTAFFEALAAHCPGTDAGESIVLVTRSWDTAPEAAYRAAIRRAVERTPAA